MVVTQEIGTYGNKNNIIKNVIMHNAIKCNLKTLLLYLKNHKTLGFIFN